MDILSHDIATAALAATNNGSGDGVVLLAGCAGEALERDVAHGDVAGRKLAKSEVVLAVAAGYDNGIVVVHIRKSVVGDVLDTAETAAALEVGGEGGWHTGPDLDASAVLCVHYGGCQC